MAEPPVPPNNILLRGNRDYTPRTEAGLQVKVDSFFVLLREHNQRDDNRNGLFFVYNVAGRYGFVPVKCVVIYQGDPPAEAARRVGVVVDNFMPGEADQLSLTTGGLVEIVDRSPRGWFFGILNKQEGWFPQDYISDWFSFARGEPLVFQFVVEAKRGQLESENPEFLPFTAFDRLDIIRVPNSNDDVWIGRDADGRIGKVQKDRLRDERGDLSSVLLKWPWYHQCDRGTAMQLMRAHLHQSNYYIIRDSSESGNFAITVTNGDINGPMNVRVEVSVTGYNVEGRTFVSLQQIVDHYGSFPIHVGTDGRQIFLHHPVTREGWIDPAGPQAAATGAAGGGGGRRRLKTHAREARHR